MKNQHPWQLLFVLAIGIFTATFWIMFGLLSVLGTQAAWWYYLVAVAPGFAILFFVLMGRREPFPYGTGLMLLGVALLGVSAWRGASLATSALIGIPAVFIGLLYVLFRKVIAEYARQFK